MSFSETSGNSTDPVDAKGEEAPAGEEAGFLVGVTSTASTNSTAPSPKACHHTKNTTTLTVTSNKRALDLIVITNSFGFLAIED